MEKASSSTAPEPKGATLTPAPFVEKVVVPEQGKKEEQALEKATSNVVPEPNAVTLKASKKCGL